MKPLHLAALLALLAGAPARGAEDPKPAETPPARTAEAGAGAKAEGAAAKKSGAKGQKGAKAEANADPDPGAAAKGEKKDAATKPCEEVRPCSID
jgi:hypothetical protein